MIYINRKIRFLKNTKCKDHNDSFSCFHGKKPPFYLMYSRNFFVLDFVRRFFVSCAQIFEAYAVRTLIKFGCDWRKIGRKGKCMKDSESTFIMIMSPQDDISFYHDFLPLIMLDQSLGSQISHAFLFQFFTNSKNVRSSFQTAKFI